MQRKCLPLVFALLCLAFGQINAQDNYNISSINQYYHNWRDGVRDVCIQGNYAYLACLGDGMRIIEINSRGPFHDVGHFMPDDSVSGYTTTIAVSGDYAYLGWESEGLLIIDASNPESPQLVRTIPFWHSFYSIKIFGNYAFISSDVPIIVDISDPINAEIVWTFEGQGDISDFDVHGDTLYAACGWQGVQIWDISQITAPQLLSTFRLNVYDYALGVAVKDSFAYLAYGGSGLKVVNINSMQEVAGIDSLSYAFSVNVRDDFAYLIYGDPECPLAIVDISDPAAPQTMGIYYPPEDIFGIALDGNLAYCANNQHGLRIVDISVPSNPHETYVYSRYGNDLGVAVVGDYAFVREEYKIKSIDISDLANPAEVGYYEFVESIADMEIVGNIAYICDTEGAGLFAMDLTDPSSIALLGNYVPGSNLHSRVAIYDHYAYLLEFGGIRIVDIADPTNMNQVAYFSADISTLLLEIFGHYAVVQEPSYSLALLDLSDPLAPEIVGHCDIGQAGKNAKEVNGKLYVASLDWMWIYDVSDPTQPTLLSETRITEDYYSYLNGIDIVGNAAYLAVSPSGLYVYNITDTANPIPSGYYDTPGRPNGVAAVGNIAFVADLSNLGIYDCTQAVSVDDPGEAVTPKTFALLPNYPNPFNAATQIRYDIPKSSNVKIDIFDISGRIVSTLVSKHQAAGVHQVTWNASEISSGTYFYRLQADNFKATRKMVVLK